MGSMIYYALNKLRLNCDEASYNNFLNLFMDLTPMQKSNNHRKLSDIRELQAKVLDLKAKLELDRISHKDTHKLQDNINKLNNKIHEIRKTILR